MKLLFLLLSAFFSALGMGYVKFFALGYLDGVYAGEDSKAWVIQVIGSVMTFGPFIAYAVSAPLVASFKKKWVMLSGMGIAILVLCAGYYTNWLGTAWFYLFWIGFVYSIYASAKVSAIPLEAKNGKYSTCFVNGFASTVFIIGMLLGIPLGTYAYDYWQSDYGVYLGVFFFFASGVFSWFLNYKNEHLVGYKESTSLLMNETIMLSSRYACYLLSTPIIWGVGGAISLAVTAYAEKHAMGSATECSLMSLYAAVGIIAGNILSTRFSGRRYLVALASSVLLFVMLLALPIGVEALVAQLASPEQVYLPLSLYMVLLGVFFGLCSNLLDSEYLRKVEEDGKEGTGAALQSAAISFFTFSIGGFVGFSIVFGWLNSVTQFILLAVLCLLAILPIGALALKSGALDMLLTQLISKATKQLLKLRYRITVKGVECLPQSGKGVLFLPNHPAEMDPVILGSYLWKDYKPRPVVVEKFYHMPFVHKLMELMHAFPMPDMQTGTGVYKKRRINQVFESICDVLNSGDSVMMYPSGQLMRSSLETMGGASGVHRILSGTGDLEVVAIRTRGLWGSSFSTALTNGQTPDLGRNFMHAFLSLLKNGIFFMPKRELEIELKRLDTDALREMNVLEVNQYLESYYNALGEEPVSLVSYSCMRHRVLEVNVQASHSTRDISSVSDVRVAEIRESFAKAFHLDVDSIAPHSRLAEDFGLDSLSMAELLIWLDDAYEVVDAEITDLHFFSDIVLLIEGEHKDVGNLENEALSDWAESARPKPSMPEGETFHECFLKKCDAMGSSIAVADELLGVLTWKQLKIAVLLFAKVFKQCPEKHIAVMLPSSVLANIIVSAVLLAGKVPVMLNWTVGRKNLEHAKETADFSQVITSAKFLDKLDNVAFGSLEEHFVFIETIKKDQIGRGEQLIAFLESRRTAASLIDRMGLSAVSPDSECVILFTSGSESAPKGVPLTHRNVLSNVRDSFELFAFNEEDSLFGFLPPFHSFGFTVTLVLPMLTGVKTSYHPNPNESRRIAKACERYQSTIMCGTPTFISNIFKASKKSQLDSLKYILVGAEKMPAALAAAVDKLPNASIFEGYGITECAPGITMNAPGKEIAGVGYPFSSVELLIVDLDSHEPLPQGERGLILVRGDSVFAAYLGDIKDPFIQINGERWYNTGDLGYLNESGALILAGRLKRFVKIAGEMISLPALENALMEKWPAGEDGPVLAVHAEEKEGERPQLCLFSAANITLDEANQVLSDAGFSNLSKLKRLVELDTLPKLGTGKVDYQELKQRIV